MFAAVVAASYLTVSGAVVVAGPKQAATPAARINGDGLDVRQVADEIKTWMG